MKYLQQFEDNTQYINYLTWGGVDADLKERLLGKIDESLYNRDPFIIKFKSNTEISYFTIHLNDSPSATYPRPIYDAATQIYSYNTFYKASRVVLPSTTTELIKLNHTKDLTSMAAMFYRCESLISLDLSSFDTSKVTDMNSMFYECESLTTLDISNFNTSKVANMYQMFFKCRALKSIGNTSAWNTSRVTDMGSVFYGCSNLTSLNLTNWDTSNVTKMSQSFYGCNSLTSLDLSSFNTSNVTDMSFMFYNCKNLTSLDLSTFDTSKVINMRYMFGYCYELTSLDLSNWNIRKVADAVSMFSYCSSLTTINGAFSGIKVNLDLSATKLTNVDNFFNALETSALTPTLALPSTAVYTQEQVTAANAKGWTVTKKSA